jgi:hypothetical protein
MSEQVTQTPEAAAAAPVAPTAEVKQPVVDPVVEEAELAAEEAKLQDDIDNAETPAEKKAAEQKMREWTLKGADGRQIKITDEKELLRRAQLGVGAEARFQEAAEIKKEAALLLKMLNEDPMGLLEELGIDTVSVSQKRLAKQLEQDAKTPEQIQREQELSELERLRQEAKTLKEERERIEYEKIMAEESRKIEDDMLSALEAEGLPPKPVYIKRMAEIMQLGIDQGIEVRASDALKLARQEITKDLRELIDGAPDDNLEDLIGSANVKRLRKKYIAKAKQAVPTPASITETGSEAPSESNRSSKKVRVSDWMRGGG